MRHLLLISILVFQTFNSFSQFGIPVNEADSIFESMHVSKDDWAVVLTVSAPGRLFDSLGYKIGDIPEGIFLLSNIDKKYLLQKLSVEYNSPVDTKVKVSKPVELGEQIDFHYTTDSIMLASHEEIYPCVYKNKRENTYGVPQGSHDPYYSMYFKTVKESGYYRDFRRMDVTKKVLYSKIINLNYHYNSRTFIFRFFSKLYKLAAQKMEAFDNR